MTDVIYLLPSETASSLPALTPAQCTKLKHLTIVSLAAKHRVRMSGPEYSTTRFWVGPVISYYEVSLMINKIHIINSIWQFLLLKFLLLKFLLLKWGQD